MRSLLLAACLLVSSQSYSSFHRGAIRADRSVRLHCRTFSSDNSAAIPDKNVPPMIVESVTVTDEIVAAVSEVDLVDAMAPLLIDKTLTSAPEFVPEATEIAPLLDSLEYAGNVPQIISEVISGVNGVLLEDALKIPEIFNETSEEKLAAEKSFLVTLGSPSDIAENVPEEVSTGNIPDISEDKIVNSIAENVLKITSEERIEKGNENGDEDETVVEVETEAETETDDDIENLYTSDNNDVLLSSTENIRKDLLPHMPGVYVLELENNCIYVGKSHQNVEGRVKEHFTSGGSAFTKKFKPISQLPTLTSFTADLESFERAETLEQMWVKGIKNVRGWQYTKLYLTEFEYESIFRQMCERKDLCRYHFL